VREDGTAALAPIGTGILLLGGRGHLIEKNKIYGNYLTGVAAIDGILAVKNPQAQSLDRNTVRGNQFGLGGTDTNGRDVAYDGSGSDNCFTLAPTDTAFPADRSTLAKCSGANGLNESARNTMLGWTGAGALGGWRATGHPAKPGYTPLEVFNP
jgi:hypothetical protein